MSINRYIPDGWVCGTWAELPANPTEFQWHDRKPLVGCNHLVCLLCEAEVKSQRGYHLVLDWEHRERVPERAILMQTSEDWSRIDGIRTEKDFRLYTCRCFYHAADRAGGILARAGRAMLFDRDRVTAMRALTALARNTGVPAERLVAQAQEELGVLVVDSAEILAAIQG